MTVSIILETVARVLIVGLLAMGWGESRRMDKEITRLSDEVSYLSLQIQIMNKNIDLMADDIEGQLHPEPRDDHEDYYQKRNDQLDKIPVVKSPYGMD
jgi:hypothetical protein